MWAVRTFGWTIMAMGVLSLVAIPFLVLAERGDEVPQSLGFGAVAVVAGFLIVRFLTRPNR